MGYDTELAERARQILSRTADSTQIRMFGGVCFMVDGSMCCGVSHNALMVRVGSAARDAALRKPHTRPMMMRGKPLSAFILVDPEGCRTDAALARWVRQAVEFVSTLSEKEASPKPKRTPRRVRG